MLDLLRVDKTLFTLMGYPMSFLEVSGTMLNLASVWLAVKRHTLNWPVGIAGVILFGVLFYQIHLYADLLEQVYYLVTGFYGWWLWARANKGGTRRPVPVAWCSRRAVTGTTAGLLAGTALLGWTTQRLDDWWPAVFPEPTTYPWWDAATTTMSFAAQILMAHRKVESWALWIAVDVIGIWLYAAKGVTLVAALYAVFLVLAVKGGASWWKEWKNTSASLPGATA